MDVYLSPQQPRWRPTTEADLQAAIDSGLFDETHRLEAKKLVEPGKGANRELARDLASFAVDGGTVIIGINENKAAGTFELAPQPLKGLTERVESVAYTIPDPPLSLVIDSIPSDAGEGMGFLLVHVPPSPAAPHMVDGRYLGRGEKQKRYLTDPEVARLHALRRQVDVDVLSLLDAEIARDPVPADERQQAHLFLAAEPTAPRPDMLLPLLDGAGWQQRLFDLINGAACDDELGEHGQFSPSFDVLSPHRRAAGAAMSSTGVRGDRTIDNDFYDPESALDVEFHYNGGVRIFMGRLSDTLSTGPHVVFDVAPLVFARRLVKMLTLIARETGYLGSWGIGLAATGLRGHATYTASTNWIGGSKQSYDRDDERRVTVATYPELERHPAAVTDRLVGHFLRTYGLRGRYEPLLTDPVDAATD